MEEEKMNEIKRQGEKTNEERMRCWREKRLSRIR
jgi:hypothetical protein